MKSTLFLISTILLFLIQIPVYFADEVIFKDEIPDLDLAHELVSFSHAIYSVNSVDGPVPTFLTPVKFFTTAFDSEVLIAKNDSAGYIVVGFQGTCSLRDALVNFYQIATTFYGPNGEEIEEAGRVHNGQNDALFNTGLYDRIEEEVVALLDENPNYSIYFTGHSQGGAYASLAAPMFAISNPSMNVTSVTFGAPRCVKQEFKDWVLEIDNLAMWTFVLRADPVPRTPKSSRGYRHVGHLIQMEDDGAILYYQVTGNEQFLGIPEDWEGKFTTSLNYLFLTYFILFLNIMF